MSEDMITCPWCKQSFPAESDMGNQVLLIQTHIEGCKERNHGIEMWCPFCMSDMKFKAVDAERTRCPGCGKSLTCKCGKPAKYICSCGILTCGEHQCPKGCDRSPLSDGLKEGLRPYNSK